MNDLKEKENKNYDMQDLLNLQGKTLENLNELSKTIGNIARNQDEMNGKMEDMQNHQKKFDEKLGKFDNRITNIEENEEINFSQQQNIRNAVNTRVYSLLNIPRRRDERSIADKITVNKYVSLFCRRCYGDTQRKGHLGDPYRTTTKKNYDAAMSDIEAWRPSNGVDALKREADDNALARKIAKEQGYLDQAEREVTEYGDKR